MVDSQITVSCQEAMNSWLEHSVDDILTSGKMKERVPAGKHILFEIQKFTIIF